jgi:PhnB protein
LSAVPRDDGRIGHAEVRIGDSVVMMFDAKPG